MSSQVAVNSIDSLKDLRVALAVYGEDTLNALGAVGAELRRTVYWLHQVQPAYWRDQIKRRHGQLASAKAELFRRKLSQTSGSSLSTAEQVDHVRKAEASLEDAEMRLGMTRKWQARIRQATLEYQASARRIKGLAAGDVPSAVNLLNRLIDSLEEYVRVSMKPTPSSLPVTTAPPEFEAIATKMIDEAPAAEVPPDHEADDEFEIESEPGSTAESPE